MNTQPEKPTRATREQLEDLHRQFAETLLAYLHDTPPEKRRSAMLEVIRGFLKDNGITRGLRSVADMKQTLTELTELDLPFFSDSVN